MSLILSDEQIIIEVCGDCNQEDKWKDEDCEICQQNMNSAAQAQLDHLASMTPEKVREEIDELIGEHLSEMGCEFTCIKTESKVLDLKDRLSDQLYALMQAQVAEAVQKDRDNIKDSLRMALVLSRSYGQLKLYIENILEALKAEVKN